MPNSNNQFQKLRYFAAALTLFAIMYVADNYFDAQLPDTNLQLNEIELRILIDDLERKPQASPHYASSKKVPNFNDYDDVTEKKQAFFAYLLPEIRHQNNITLIKRKAVVSMTEQLANKTNLSPFSVKLLKNLRREYKIEKNLSNKQAMPVLLKRIDMIPAELVLIQAANESGWGTSRFARQGYNFFGLWCFKQGCGFVPKRRNEGTVHEVAKFKDLSHAVKTYIRNLNRHYAYQELRDIRANLRAQDKPITAKALVHGLQSYSERGQDYIDELLSMMRVNKEHMNL
ncbi:MAG: glucosaminidase domain-containing protein [Paraglaciecola polaris]|uniref:glucosaminidase domain-containing protein n=1 Tax=Paraglaciecola polaris TaxID=222814 RepID=UPI003003315B|tara:strand:- start:1731 stop:2591 length:861 start_codon:yes stop_codon:yes gene_type:complete